MRNGRNEIRFFLYGRYKTQVRLNQRDSWVKDGVLGEWLCIGTLELKMVFLGKMAVERGFWVKNVFFWQSKMISELNMGFGGNGHAKGLLG